MSNPVMDKFASVLLHYSVEIEAGQQLIIYASPLAEELALALYAEAVRSGAFVTLQGYFPGSEEILFKYASDAQLDYIPPVDRLADETFDRQIYLRAPENTRALSHIDPDRQARKIKSYQPFRKIFFDRSARGELRWCYTIYPTNAMAQEADMSLADYEDFVYRACKLDKQDPVAAWRKLGKQERELKNWLEGKDRVVLKGSDIDLSLSIEGRTFVEGDGKVNMPDGEIFTGPVENSANGWVRFRYPAIVLGREVSGIELWFEDGKVVKECAHRGQETLTSMLDSDPGARYLGEWGIGVNYSIKEFTRSILFDEKLGGTIHLALGASYPETGGINESGLHWDMICDMGESEILVDGELFYRNGVPLLWT